MIKFRNLKITKAILTLEMLAIFFIIVIGMSALRYIRIINNNSLIMLKNNMEPLAYLNEVRSDYLNIRIKVNRANSSYKKEYNNEIKNYDNNIKKNLNS
ncbi:Membrane associated methyl-accepting chemotaxis protein [Clostridium tetanomorphum DSM 665]|nr:Membrane associated methyl-accepting chemotaxis protein [Clostridium tetanomorphum DSM 665]